MQQEHDRERYVPLARTFHALTATGDEEDPWSGLPSLGGTTWADLLAKPRVLLLSEAGSGKTREVESAANELRAAGKTAFFLRLEFIKDALEDAFEVGSYEEFQAWLASQSEEAWLFLDSIDEAKLGSPLDFQLAIRKIGGRIKAAKDRAHVVLTGRMFAWQPTTDLAFCQTHLGYTPRAKAAADSNDDESNGTTSFKVARGQADTPNFEVFALDDLTADQAAKLASARGVTDTEAFLAEIERADAWSFASRPQDLQDLSDFWLDNGRIGTRSEIVSNNIARRLQERDPTRAQIRPIAADKVRQGACVLAAATTLMQVQTLRVPDAVGGLPGIDLRDLLPDWDDKDHLALLSRPIFDAPIYGAQRFHHRSVREFLAAEWFSGLLGNKTSRRNIESLFFKEQYGIQIVVPSLRPLLPWLILLDPPMLERVRLVAPEIVFEGGDPAALPFEVRRQILREICEQMAGGSVGRSMRDVSAVQRFAGPDLSDEIRELLVLYAGNPDLRAFLLRMVWLGKIESLRAEVLALAVTPTLEHYERITAIRAVEAVGHPGDMEQIRSAFANEAAPLNRQWLTEIVDGSEVSEAVISWLAQCLEKAEVPSKHTYDQLPSSMEKMIDKSPADLLPRFVEVFDRLMGRPPLIERRFCEISEVFEWLIEPAACVMKRLVDERNPAIFEEPSLFLLQKLSTGHSYGRNRIDEKIPAIQSGVRSWPELNKALFWFEVQQCRAKTLERDNDSVTHYWPAIFRSFCAFDVSDFDYVAGEIATRRDIDDRLVALSLAFDLYLKAGRPAAWRKRLKDLAATDPTLDVQLAKSMKPPKKSASERKHQETMARWKRQDAARTKAESENAASWNVGLRNGLEKERAALLKYPGQVTNAVHYLYQHSRGDGLQSGRWTQYNWKELAADFGDEVAQFYRDATVGFWREYTPRVLSEGAPGNTTSNATIIGLVGLEIEATETPGWPTGLKPEEVDLACRYASCELNGFPTWFPTLFAAFPERVSAFLMREIRYELTTDPAVDTNYILSDLQWSGQWAWNTLGPHVLSLLLDDEPTSTLVLDRLLSILQGSDVSDADLESLAFKKCAALIQTDHLARWYAVLTGVSPSTAIEALKASLEALADVDRVAVNMIYITKIWGGRFEEKTNVRGAFKTPTHLKDLYLLVNTYVRVAEDLNRANSGVYSPELRDHAQGAREKLFEMLRDIPGKEAFLAIMEIAKGHPNEALRPWTLHHATSKAELDGDSAAWSSQQVLDFGRMMERTPANHRELAELAELRFLDFRDDVEHGDESIAKLLQLVPLETDMRNYIGRELRTNAHGRFSIPQEEELADAKRPDLRFHGIGFDSPVPVELKLADNWTGPQLFERLENQLCGDYLRDNRSGIGLFVLVNRGKAGWDVPGSDSRVDFAGLLDSLAEYWRLVSGRYVNVDNVIVIGIDLRKRFG